MIPETINFNYRDVITCKSLIAGEFKKVVEGSRSQSSTREVAFKAGVCGLLEAPRSSGVNRVKSCILAISFRILQNLPQSF